MKLHRNLTPEERATLTQLLSRAIESNQKLAAHQKGMAKLMETIQRAIEKRDELRASATGEDSKLVVLLRDATDRCELLGSTLAARQMEGDPLLQEAKTMASVMHRTVCGIGQPLIAFTIENVAEQIRPFFKSDMEANRIAFESDAAEHVRFHLKPDRGVQGQPGMWSEGSILHEARIGSAAVAALLNGQDFIADFNPEISE